MCQVCKLELQILILGFITFNMGIILLCYNWLYIGLLMISLPISYHLSNYMFEKINYMLINCVLIK